MAEVRIGTSGWSYGHWDGVLYPPGTPPRERLGRFTAEFDAVELNASFYRWPSVASFASWRRRLPDGFALSVKAPRGLTHGRRLYRPEVWVERIAAGWHALGPRRRTLLVQLAGSFDRDNVRLGYFLTALPDWIDVAVELRHPSWQTDPVFDLLAEHRAAYTVLSGAGLPCVLRATCDRVYIRLHGPDGEHLYAGSYSDDDLRWWADRIREWQAQGRSVEAYFNNDGHGHAVRNARRLRALLA